MYQSEERERERKRERNKETKKEKKKEGKKERRKEGERGREAERKREEGRKEKRQGRRRKERQKKEKKIYYAKTVSTTITIGFLFHITCMLQVVLTQGPFGWMFHLNPGLPQVPGQKHRT
jgi:hypothetical protein